MSKALRILIFICVLGLACSAGALVSMMLNSKGSANAAQPVSGIGDTGLRILPFQLIDHNGNAATEAELEGQWTIVDFIFTNCPGACPVMTARMVEAAQRLEGKPVRFASFSIDERRDTPERLREFADGYGIDLERWSFYTGDDKQTRRMVAEGLMLVVDEEADNEISAHDGTTMKNIQHPTRLFLVSPELKVVGLYSSGVPSELDRLVSDLESVLSGE